jgi:predicted ribosome quality control (RQC) complex YloA/Tae2 family protein
MLSLKELRRVAGIVDSDFRGHRVERWVQPDATSLALSLYGRDPERDEGRKRVFYFSCHANLARLSEIDRLPKAPDRPPAFSSYLRAHLSRAVIKGARLLDEDRQLALRFSAREGEFDLLLAILGNRSNLYVLDAAQEIVAALRPLADVRPELSLGALYRSPGSNKPAAGIDRWQDAPADSYFTEIEAFYGPKRSDLEAADLARRLSKVLKREAKNARRRLEKIEAELAEADHADEYARHGELLKSVLGKISPGDSEVRVRDYVSGEQITIPLDPKKDPKGNLEATFKRYQKLLRRLAKAGGQVEGARDWLNLLEHQLARVGEQPVVGEERLAALQRIAAVDAVGKLLRKQSAAGTGPDREDLKSRLPARLRDVPTRLMPRRYLSLDGLEIWVGRSDEGNDHLSMRLARGKDLFFHVEGAPGSHVILRTEGREDPPSDSLLDACELAVRYSKQKNAGSAEVHAVPIKNVSKPKGAKRGLVHVTGGKTIRLRHEPERLARILESKID